MMEAITFDLWGTLIQETPEGLRRARELRIGGTQGILQESGSPVSRWELEAAYEEMGQRMEAIWEEQMDIGPREQVQLLLLCLDHQLPSPREGILARLEEAYSSAILQATPILSEGAAELLSALKGAGYRIGLICNTGRTPGSMLRIVLGRLGLLNLFDGLTFSNELRLRKPNPLIFWLTLKQLGAHPGRSLHVGDDPRADVAGAKGAGMRAAHLCRSGPSAAEADGIIRGLPELPDLLRRIEEGDR